MERHIFNLRWERKALYRRKQKQKTRAHALNEREQENKGLSCLSGEKVPYGTDMPDLCVCGFAHYLFFIKQRVNKNKCIIYDTLPCK